MNWILRQDPYRSQNPKIRIGDIVVEPIVINNSLSSQEVKKSWRTTSSAMSLIYLGFAQIEYQRNRLETALAKIIEYIKYAEPIKGVEILCQAYIISSNIHQIKGNSKLSSELMDKALSLAQKSQAIDKIAVSKTATIELALLRDDINSAKELAKQQKTSIDDQFSNDLEKRCILKARIYCLCNKFEEAINLLKALRPRSEKRHRYESVLVIDIILAAAQFALGEKDEATGIMSKTLEFALIEGYVRPFLDSALLIREILLTLRKTSNGPIRIYVRDLLKECVLKKETPEPSKHLPIGDMETLTPREVQILKLIVAGLSNQEIANNIFVSLSTVKTHINHIYSKLGVEDRNDAIVRSRSLLKTQICLCNLPLVARPLKKTGVFLMSAEGFRKKRITT